VRGCRHSANSSTPRAAPARPTSSGCIGSPATVTEKIEKIYQEVGGFGVLLVFGFDYKHKPEAWHNSLRLLKQEVLPRLKHLDASVGRAA
jgi:alkanesulfonate monooxygenase SsuD/methylene tetrahydromethanopterin reductase-like flavin-dependent oxidoreductase (luciferase family)